MPSVTYTVTIQNSVRRQRLRAGGLPAQHGAAHWDEALSLNDTAYVTKLVEYPETPEKDSITIPNDLSSVGGLSLDGVIARITGIAEIVNSKRSLYDRPKPFRVTALFRRSGWKA